MLEIYQYFMYTKIFTVVACVIFCYLIAKTKVAPTVTYMLLSGSYVVLLILQLLNFYYADLIGDFLESFSKTQLLIVQILATGAYAMQLTAFLKKYAILSRDIKK